MAGSGAGATMRLIGVTLIVSITQIALTVGFTSLTFRDELSGDFALGLAVMFIGMLITATVVGSQSGLAGHVVSPQDSGLAVLSVVAPTVAATTDAPGETIVVLMGLSSIAVGLTMWGLGRAGLGRMIRFLPYPVLAGFLAGTGLVMARGAFWLAASGISGDATGGGERVGRLAVVVAVAVLMVAISRSSLPNERYVPPVVIGSIGVFHIVWAVAGVDRVEGAKRGWLLPVLPEGSLVDGDTLTFATRADWSAVFEQLPAVLPLLLLAPLTLLLYLGALEAVLDVDIDTDREFQIIGRAGAAAGLFGGAPSYTQFANTMLVQRMAGPVRIVPVVIGMSAVLALVFGDDVIGLVPQPVVAGMLGFIALSFILDWTWDLRHRISRVELALTVLVAASIPLFGFLAGVGFGLVLTAGRFVVQYSQISGVRRARDASRVRSNAYRSSADDEILVASGREVLVVELEGFLFFGTGDAVVRTVTTWPGIGGVRIVLIDFTRVSGADSSAVASFAQLVRWARQADVEVIWVAANANVRRTLSPLFDGGQTGRTEVDIDRALSAIEDVALTQHRTGHNSGAATLLDHPVVAVADVRELEVGGHLVRVGEPVDGLFVVERGRVSVLGTNADTRLRRLGPGAVLGELSLYGETSATATVVADEPTTVRHVTAASVDALERADPAAAADFHRALATIGAERLRNANAAVESFRDR